MLRRINLRLRLGAGSRVSIREATTLEWKGIASFIEAGIGALKRWGKPAIAYGAILYALLLGVLNVAQAVGISLSKTLFGMERYLYVFTWREAWIPSLFLGVFMIYLAYQLWLRKRAALIVLAAYLMFGAVVEILGGREVVAGVVSIAAALVLLLARAEFPARPDPRSLRRFKITAPLLLAIFFGCGVAGLYFMRETLGLVPNAYQLVYKVPIVAIGEGGLHFNGWGMLYRNGLISLAVLGIAYLTVLLFSPHREVAGQTAAEHELARGIVRRYGSDSLAYFNLRRDKNLFFYGNDIVLAYRPEGNVVLISGDPIGPTELVPEIIMSFRGYCAERGWRVAALGSRGDFVEFYEAAGLNVFTLGEEAIIDLGEFTLEGRKVRKLRQSVNRIKKMGVTIECMFNAGIPSHLRHELTRMSSDWRGDKPETGFSMGLGRLMDCEDPDCLLSVAYDSSMEPLGFIYLVPMYPGFGYSLDITRTMVGSPNGLSEFLLTGTALFLKENGYKQMSLHFVALSQHYRGDREEAGSRFWYGIAKGMDHILPVLSMYRFDKKFLPRWKKRYLIYQSAVDFPFIGVAAASAESVLKISRPGDRKE